MIDVAIIGGGPAGSTAGSLLKKYAPNLQVSIFEKEVFPRDHVGESQLPPISKILDEMGCWDKVEAANFPIKIGATYRWGSSPNLWDFEFLPLSTFKDEARPAKYAGQRLQTAFQVDRARYDEILLDHAEETGCEVHRETSVSKVHCDGDKVTSLILQDGSRIEARHYIDASGNAAILRKAMGVKITEPAALKNIAIWAYWDNADWAVEIGVGGTRVQVMSIGTGWIWFIPLSPTRTSIGFICPAEHYKSSGKTTEELYLEALPQDARIQGLITNARMEGAISATKDWSFLSERMVGKNWFLAGESGGFADPILAAGMTLAHAGAREAAYIILEIERDELDSEWLKHNFEQTQKRRIGQHIRFADFWYASNGQFSDLEEHTAKIARDAGLNLSPRQAFQWLGTGGFTNDVTGQAGIGGLDLAGVKQVATRFGGEELPWEISRYNEFKLYLNASVEDFVPVFSDGSIRQHACFIRRGKVLLNTGIFALVIAVLRQSRDLKDILNALQNYFKQNKVFATPQLGLQQALQALEVMVAEGWVKGKLDKKKPRINVSTPFEGDLIHSHVD
jgi:flavin-dependent dehydrogenase